MPIEVSCGACQHQIRVPDKYAGKKVKCPKCEATIAVPAGASQATPVQPTPTPAKPAPAPVRSRPAAQVPQAAAPGWFMKAADGQEYGPVDQAQLDRWVTEGRIDDNCQLLREDWDQWRWAQEIFPQLTPAAASTPVAATGFPQVDAGGGTGYGQVNTAPSQPYSTPTAQGRGQGRGQGTPSDLDDTTNKYIGIGGGIVLFISFFLPCMTIMGQSAAFFDAVSFKGGASEAVMAMCAMMLPVTGIGAVIIAFINRYKLQMIPGFVALICTGIMTIKLINTKPQLELLLGKQVADSFSIGFGIFIAFIASTAVILAGMMPPKRKRVYGNYR